MSYVEVPSEAILSFLTERGFTERVFAYHNPEVVYERAHSRDDRYKVLVYTSVRRGSTRARAKGKDAIRVCAIFEGPNVITRGVAKLPRVHRTGSVEAVLGRVLQRMREAWTRCNREIGKSRNVSAPGGAR